MVYVALMRARKAALITTNGAPSVWLRSSSIASAFGNAGQVDYAAANDALDMLAERLVAAGRRAVALAWGPWGGGGMASPELEREYARRGMGLIDPADGARAFVAEVAQMHAGGPARVVLVNADARRFAWEPGDIAPPPLRI